MAVVNCFGCNWKRNVLEVGEARLFQLELSPLVHLGIRLVIKCWILVRHRASQAQLVLSALELVDAVLLGHHELACAVRVAAVEHFVLVVIRVVQVGSIIVDG